MFASNVTFNKTITFAVVQNFLFVAVKLIEYFISTLIVVTFLQRLKFEFFQKYDRESNPIPDPE